MKQLKKRTEEEIQAEAKRVRYERAKRISVYSDVFLQGYYVALRWVQGKGYSIFMDKTRKELSKMEEE